MSFITPDPGCQGWKDGRASPVLFNGGRREQARCWHRMHVNLRRGGWPGHSSPHGTAAHTVQTVHCAGWGMEGVRQTEGRVGRPIRTTVSVIPSVH